LSIFADDLAILGIHLASFQHGPHGVAHFTGAPSFRGTHSVEKILDERIVLEGVFVTPLFYEVSL